MSKCFFMFYIKAKDICSTKKALSRVHRHFTDQFNYVDVCRRGTDPITRYFRSILNLKVKFHNL